MVMRVVTNSMATQTHHQTFPLKVEYEHSEQPQMDLKRSHFPFAA
jgi:hypothetical protein